MGTRFTCYGKLRVCLFLLLLPLFSLAQKTVTGRVLSSTDQTPIPGASVAIKGSKSGTSTGVDGNFFIKAKQGDVLVITGVGIIRMEYTVGAAADFTISVQQNATDLNEVVVTALGIKKEAKRLGYSVQEVKGDELIKAREANPLGALAGKIAGLNVGINQELLSTPAIILRGNTVDLFVVDGIPINSDTWNISPDDVETFTVLKSPAAAALYGNRGINGAILITTKHAKKNQKGFTVEVNSSNQFSKGFIAIPKVQGIYGGGDDDTYAFGDGNGGGVNDADYDVWGTKMDGRLLPQYDGKFDPTQNYTTTFQDGSTYTGHIQPAPYVVRGVDNLKGFIQTGVLSTTNVNFAATTDKSNVRFSVTNTFQKGIVPNTQLNTTNFNLYASSQLSDRFKIEGNMNYNRQYSPNIPDVNYGPNSIIYNIDVWTGADWNIDQMRNYWQPGEIGSKSIFIEYKRYQNPWFMSYEWLRSHAKNDLYGWIGLSYKINKNMDAMVRTNVTTYNIFRTEKLPFSAHPYGEEFDGGHGQYREDHRDLWENNTDLLVKYNGDLSKSGGISISALGGLTARTFRYNSNFTTTTYLIVPEVYNFSNTLDPIRSFNYSANMLVLSAYYSVDLNFSKYLTLSTTGRVDKSSSLAPSNNSFFYPSFSLSTVISDYTTMPTAISFLKVRASYASVRGGNTLNYINTTPSIPSYGSVVGYGGDYLSPYNGPNFTASTSNSSTTSLIQPYLTAPLYNNQAAANTSTTAVNPDINPFKRINYEGGFDIRFLKNRLGFSATYFKYINGPQIYAQQVSQTSGFTNYLTNALRTDRSGGEMSLSGVAIQSKEFHWDVLINWGTYREIYLELPPGTSTINSYYHKGDRVDEIFNAKEATTPDGKVIHDPSGLVIHLPVAQDFGHSDPDFTWGIINNFTYKGFSLSFQFDGAVGGKIQDYVRVKDYQGGRAEGTVEGVIGQARAYEAVHWGEPGYSGAYQNGKPIMGADGVQVSNGTPITYDPVSGKITNFKDLQFAPNASATQYIQDYVEGFYADPDHTITSRTYAKLRQVTLGYTLPARYLTKTFISKVQISVIGRNLLYFFKKDFKDIDVDQYPGVDVYNGRQQITGLQTPTTRSIGFNVNVVF
jgi:TonB-linked SusC/RagA family outer membrane protein